MDNNSQPVQPQPAQQPQTNPVISQIPPLGGENKMMLWLIVGLIVIVLVVGRIYFYLNSKQQATPTSAPQTQSSLEKDLNAVQVDDVEKDFTSVDQDLQTL